MTLYYDRDCVAVHHGNCLDVIRSLPDCSVDAVVTDPPYGLANTTPADVTRALTAWLGGDREWVPSGRGFMGHEWDAFVPPPAVWDECLRVLKPGGHLAAFAGSRTQDLMGLSIRLAGFDVRDSVAWMFGGGFPKSLDVSKAIASGGGRPEDIRRLAMGNTYTPSGRGRVNYDHGGGSAMNGSTGQVALTPAAQQWQGWGTALKPGHEPVILARKPLAGTVAANVQEWGTGALNIDGCRIGDGSESQGARDVREASAARRYADSGAVNLAATPGPRGGSPAGRWPANVALDEDAARVLDEQSGESGPSFIGKPCESTEMESGYGGGLGGSRGPRGHNDSGGASRFFYTAKADAAERVKVDGTAHPTVKPLSLMRWLVRLITPPGGTILEPFAGSGTTVEACILEGFDCIAAEAHEPYLPLIVQRINRRRDPVQAVKATGDDGGLFDLLEGA